MHVLPKSSLNVHMRFIHHILQHAQELQSVLHTYKSNSTLCMHIRSVLLCPEIK